MTTETSPEEDDKYDLVIEGTGLSESILAAAASWAGKKVLHVDKNTYYGAHWAALSVEQLDAWVEHQTGKDSSPYCSLKLTRLPTASLNHPSPLQASRAYSIDLSPHLLYCSSALVSCLANTRLSEYLEFKALEHISIFQKNTSGEIILQKVPSSRDDVFTSDLSLQEKRKLMKFLNFAINHENIDDLMDSLDATLSSPEYNLPLHLRHIIQYAIALSPTPDIPASTALHAIRRHLNGFGVYGAFPLLVPLHGGGGEIAQAFCRSAAVKGATYILGRAIQQITQSEETEYPLKVDFSEVGELPFAHAKTVIRLAPFVAGAERVEICQSVSIVEGIFDEFFGEESMHKDAALIIIPPGTVRPEQQMPIQVIVHGGGTGECPLGQWILYCRTQENGDSGLENLERAERLILQQVSGKTDEVPRLLRLTYKYMAPKVNVSSNLTSSGEVFINHPTASMDFDDAYNEAWNLFTQLYGDEDFLVREGLDEPNMEDD